MIVRTWRLRQCDPGGTRSIDVSHTQYRVLDSRHNLAKLRVSGGSFGRKCGPNLSILSLVWMLCCLCQTALLTILHASGLLSFVFVCTMSRMQNTTGGYATCEKTRGSKMFEWFNASEVFGEIMVDYDYIECKLLCYVARNSLTSITPPHYNIMMVY